MIPQCGNPLLRDWMREEMNKIQPISKNVYFTYKKAYESLNRCPLEFAHPAEAVVLEGIGPAIVRLLTHKLKEYCKDNGLPMPPDPTKVRRKRTAPQIDDDDDIRLDDNGAPIPFRPKPKRKPRAYVPKFRTGGYGILLALLDIHDVGRADATEQQICRLAQDHCDSSYTLKEPGSNYTAWNSMKTLVEKGYVYKNGSPRKYQLTETGFSLAEKLKQVNSIDRGNGGGGGGSSSLSSRASPATLPMSSGAAFAAAIGSDSDDDVNAIDLSQYVLNPEQYTSISINGRSSGPSSSNPSTARSHGSRKRFDDSMDIDSINWEAIHQVSREQQQQQQQSTPTPSTSTTSSRADIMAALSVDDRNSSGRSTNRKYARKPKRTTGSSTASILDSLLDSMGGEDALTRPDMSLYVLNPSEHQSISLNGRSVTTNTPSTSSYNRPPLGTASVITNTSTSSLARRVMNETDDNSVGNLARPTTKYKTPATSSILLKDAAAKRKHTAKGKRQYNVDEFEMDLSDLSSVPDLSSTQLLLQPTRDDIVDLLSSPEPSPALRPAAASSNLTDDDELTFGDSFDPDKDYFPLSQSRNKQIVNETFHFTFLDTDNQPQRHLAKAAVDLDHVNGGLSYLVKYQTKQSSHPKAQHMIKKRVEGEFTIAYLPEIYREAVCPGLPASPILPLHREEEDNFWPESTSNSAMKTTSRNKTTSGNSSQSCMQQSSQTDLESQPFFPSQQQKKQDFDALIAREPITETLLPNQYEIVLVLDSREIQMKGNRSYFQESLAAKGVQCMTRSMDLGDVIWIARPIGSTNQAEELFLDYILERKRLDDLVSSIKDGRFIEQKTRLKRTGAKKVVYVVENYNREEAERFGLQAVQTAMSSTQIIDGIFLKRTNTIDETIDYLVSVTKLVKRIYQGHTLHAIPGHIITRQNYLDLKQAYTAKATNGGDDDDGQKEAYLVSYPVFGQLNSKSGSTSVHEVYLRMLMTIRGVNAERALSLMKVYPTPRALLMAFKDKSPKDAKNLAKNATQDHISRRRWGAKISESLYEVWGALKYPSAPESDDEEDEEGDV